MISASTWYIETFLSFKKFRSIYCHFLFEWERERGKERGVLHLLVYSQNGCYNESWVRQKPKAQNPLQVCHVCQEPKYLSHHLMSPRVCISMDLELEVESVPTNRHFDMRCGNPQWCLHCSGRLQTPQVKTENLTGKIENILGKANFLYTCYHFNYQNMLETLRKIYEAAFDF